MMLTCTNNKKTIEYINLVLNEIIRKKNICNKKIPRLIASSLIYKLGYLDSLRIDCIEFEVYQAHFDGFTLSNQELDEIVKLIAYQNCLGFNFNPIFVFRMIRNSFDDFFVLYDQYPCRNFSLNDLILKYNWEKDFPFIFENEINQELKVKNANFAINF